MTSTAAHVRIKSKEQTMKNNNKAVEVYNYLLNRCEGRENGVPAQVLADELKMPLRRLREVIQAINESPQFERLISVTQRYTYAPPKKSAAEP